MFRTALNLLVFQLAIALFFVQPAHAYLDPGTGTFILQSIVAGIFGAAYYLKLNWQKLKTGFQNRFSGSRTTHDQE